MELALGLARTQAMLEGSVSAPSVRGVVELDGERAVGVWIAALEPVRVRQLGDPVPLRFIRVVDGNTAVVEAGVEVAPGPGGERRWELLGSPSAGGIWSIEADAATRVVIERVVSRPPRYVSVEVEHEIAKWIVDDEPVDRMPGLLEPADDLVGQLRVHAALADELLALGPADANLEHALVAWRMLAAFNSLDVDRPIVRPYYAADRSRSLALAGTRPRELAGVEARSYQLAEAPRRWPIERKGPGQLRISARTWAPAGEALARAELRVWAGGRVVARLPLSDRAAQHALDPNTSLPRFEALLTREGEQVGEYAQRSIALASEAQTYELELIGGPALISLDGGRRIEASLASLRGWTPRKRAKAAAHALRKTRAEAAPWLELLLAEQSFAPTSIGFDDPRFDALGQQSPMLALASLAVVASDPSLDPQAFAGMVARARTWLAALAREPSVDPRVRAWLRTRWLELLALHAQPQLVSALTERVRGGADPVVELPLAGLRLLADLLGPSESVERSPALALLELARSRAPADEGLRSQILRLWSSASRWSTRRAQPIEGRLVQPEFTFEGEWFVPSDELADDLDHGWLRLEPGRAARVETQLGSEPIRRDLSGHAPEARRMQLLDIYVSTPLGDPAPVLVRVDDRRWWSPQLFGVQRHRVAVPEGVHEIQLEGPAQTRAWASLPAAKEGADRAAENEATAASRREPMWSLPDSSWRLAGPAVPGHVRVRLRWPESLTPRPVRITVHEDQGVGAIAARDPNTRTGTLLFDPRAVVGSGDAATVRATIDLDLEAVAIEGAARVSPRHDLLVPIAASTTRIWFEVEDDLPILASLAQRRGVRVEDGGPSTEPLRTTSEAPSFDRMFAELAELDGDAILEQLAALGASLLTTPHDLDQRGRRAALLLMLGETGLARADLVRLSAQAEREQLSAAERERTWQLLAALDQRFNDLIDPRELLVSAAGVGASPILIEPAIAAVVGEDRDQLEPWLELWAQTRARAPDQALAELELELRRRGVDESGEPALLGALTRAHLLGVDPIHARAASRAWLELYARMPGTPGSARQPIAVGVAAVTPLLAHLEDPSSDGRDAGVGHGLALELLAHYGHTTVRSLAFIAALRSDWTSLDHSEANAGFERLELPLSELEPTDSTRVREAVLAAPWSGEPDVQVRAGRKSVLAWDARPGLVSAQLWCRAARPDLNPSLASLADQPAQLGRASLHLRLLDSKGEVASERSVEVADAELGLVELPIESSGRHQLELALANDPMWMCSWRADVGSTSLGEARKRARWWTADAKRGVEFVILGPATLHIEARGLTDNNNSAEQAPTLRASVERVTPREGRPRAPTQAGELALDREAEQAVITESRRRFGVAHATHHTVLLIDPVPYRVQIATDQGRALIRAEVRRDRGDLPPPARVSIRELGEVNEARADPFDRALVGAALPVVARDEIEPVRNRVGTLDAALRVGVDDFDGVDSFRVRFGVAASLGWRRELVQDVLWLRLAAQLLTREQSPVAAGGLLGMGARIPKLGVRLGALLDVLAQSYAGRSEASVRLTGFIDRPTWLGRYLQLRPGLGFGLRWQSLTASRVAAANAQLEPHPRIYLDYIHDHPVMLRPELGLRAYVYQDLAFWTRASLVLNSNMVTVDSLDLEVGLTGIGRLPRPWVPTWGLSYQASNRYLDDDRSATMLRHRIEAQLGLGVWARDLVRVAVGVSNQLFLSSSMPMRDVIGVWIRLDGAFGRRTRDYGPSELWFVDSWAPRSWGDDEHQAQSTQSRVNP